MNAPHCGHLGEGEAQNIANLVDIDARHKHRDQHNAQPGLSAGLNGPLLLFKQRASAQRLIGAVPQTVELQKDTVQPRLPETAQIFFVAGDAQAVCVELEKGETSLPAHSDDFRQVLPLGRFTAGELDIEGTAASHHLVEPLSDVFQRRILSLGAPGGGVADGAAQGAALGDLQQDAAGMLPVFGTEPAVVGAAPLNNPRAVDRGGGDFFVSPALIGELTSPYLCFKMPVTGTVLLQVDLPSIGHTAGRDSLEADRADALGCA